MRWFRFYTKLRKSSDNSPTKPTGVQTSPKSTSKAAKLRKGGAKSELGEDGGRMDADDELEDIPETLCDGCRRAN